MGEDDGARLIFQCSGKKNRNKTYAISDLDPFHIFLGHRMRVVLVLLHRRRYHFLHGTLPAGVGGRVQKHKSPNRMGRVPYVGNVSSRR